MLKAYNMFTESFGSYSSTAKEWEDVFEKIKKKTNEQFNIKYKA